MDGRAEKTEKILLADASSEDLQKAKETLDHCFPDAFVDTVESFEAFQSQIHGNSFDVVVLDLDLCTDSNVIELIYRLKMEDYEPSIVVVSKDPPARVVNELYKHGCHRCIEKSETWLEELGGAVDYIIKWRKAKAENLLLRAKLTETNLLLQEKNQRLDEFSASVAHDIRGPLGGISMKIEYLLDTYGDGIEDRFRELLKKSLQSTGRLINLVQAMYEYAKLGPQAAKMEKISLSDLVQEVLEDMPFEKSLDVRVDIDELPVVYANADLLRRVFVNLINNAVRYNDKQYIQLRFKLQGIQNRVLAPFCEIAVQDNGVGIPERELKDVFSMFVRASSSKGDHQGMGVGLAVVKRIVDLHYGTVRVESKVGEGSTFFLSLPMEPVQITDE